MDGNGGGTSSSHSRAPSSRRRLNNSWDESAENLSCLLSWAAHPVPVGDIRRAGKEEQGQAVLLHRRTITPALGLKPWPTSVLPPLEGNISPPQPAPSPPFQSGNSQCVPSKNTE